MKTPSSSIKILTISVFTALIVCFVCYRVGAFDTSQTSEELKTSDLEFRSDPNAIDTPIVAKDSVIVHREIMSSSKSMIIPRTTRVDTIKKTSPAKTPSDSSTKKVLKRTTIMSSSKSAIIYEPEPLDTSKNKKK